MQKILQYLRYVWQYGIIGQWPVPWISIRPILWLYEKMWQYNCFKMWKLAFILKHYWIWIDSTLYLYSAFHQVSIHNLDVSLWENPQIFIWIVHPPFYQIEFLDNLIQINPGITFLLYIQCLTTQYHLLHSHWPNAFLVKSSCWKQIIDQFLLTECGQSFNITGHCTFCFSGTSAYLMLYLLQKQFRKWWDIILKDRV